MIKSALFLSSYSPLFALLAVRFEDGTLSLACGGLALAGLLAFLAILAASQRMASDPRTFLVIRDEGPQVAGYLATYLLPLLVVSQPTGRDLLAYAGYLIVFGVVFVRSDMVQVNPLLYLVGYRVFFAEDPSRRTYYLLVSGARPLPGPHTAAEVWGNLLLLDDPETAND